MARPNKLRTAVHRNKLENIQHAFRQLPFLFQVTEEWNSVPKKIQGNFITVNALRIYMANTTLGWSKHICAHVFGTARNSIVRHVHRVEDAREEPWVDDLISKMEETLNSIQELHQKVALESQG